MQHLAILGVVDAVTPVHRLDGLGQPCLACQIQQQLAGFGCHQVLGIVQEQRVGAQAEVFEALRVLSEKLGNCGPGRVQIQVMRSEFLP